MILTGPGNAPSGHSVTAGQLTFVGTPLRASDEGLLEARRKSAAPMPAASGLRLVGCGAACWGVFGGYLCCSGRRSGVARL